jgi:hypothetical protein
MAHQFFYPNGSQHQDYLECRGCDCSDCLASQGFWGSYHADGLPCLKLVQMSPKRIFGVLFSTIGLGSLIYNITLFFNSIKGEGDFKMLLLRIVLSLLLFGIGAIILRKTKSES